MSTTNSHCNITAIKKYISEANIIFEIGAHDGRDIDLINNLWDGIHGDAIFLRA